MKLNTLTWPPFLLHRFLVRRTIGRTPVIAPVGASTQLW